MTEKQPRLAYCYTLGLLFSFMWLCGCVGLLFVHSTV